jgi:hypothetical protein
MLARWKKLKDKNVNDPTMNKDDPKLIGKKVERDEESVTL